ncbi:nudix hydrolase [Niveomyces insectorum RCEF 264]|uniref:Nudix hydrolase n=1 Tax=Niveomyces insectorum RCEF 264 TaxID=1081102 RepID=A0A167VD55_9HYPO|nr:nudix hydrolase [Niveomyces insectorum RCEF 264]
MAASVAAHGNNDEPPLNMDFINRAMTFTPSERCTISCGTVCVDPRMSKVLIIFNRRLRIWQLPKGRKNIGEDLHAAALRETYEETGVHAALLRLKIRTRSTRSVPPSGPNGFASSTGDAERETTLHRSTLSTASSASSASTAYSSSAASTTSSTFSSLSAPPTVTESNAALGERRDSSWTMEEQEQANDGATPDEDWDAASIDVSQHLAATDVAAKSAADDRVARPTNGGSTPLLPHASAAAAATADPKVTSDVFNNELVGIVQYPDLQASTPYTIKTVFFFAAHADSSAPMGVGAQEDHEDLRAEWVDYEVADQRLRFDPEKEAVWKVRRDMHRSGISCQAAALPL